MLIQLANFQVQVSLFFKKVSNEFEKRLTINNFNIEMAYLNKTVIPYQKIKKLFQFSEQPLRSLLLNNLIYIP